MSSIVDTMNRIQANQAGLVKRAENYRKWHPVPEPDPVCACGQVFRTQMKVVTKDDGGLRQVVITAKVKQQIHDMAFTFKGISGMCLLSEDTRRSLMATA